MQVKTVSGRTPGVSCRRVSNAKSDLVSKASANPVKNVCAHSGILKLHTDGSIGDAEFLAADRLYRAYALAEQNVVCPTFRASGAATVDGNANARLEASTSYQAACAALGPSLTRVLVDVVFRNLSLRSIAEKHGCTRNNISGLVIAALRRLTDHYAQG